MPPPAAAASQGLTADSDAQGGSDVALPPVQAGVQVVRGFGDHDRDGQGLEKVDLNSAAGGKMIGGGRGRASRWAPDRFDANEIECIRKPGNEG